MWKNVSNSADRHVSYWPKLADERACRMAIFVVEAMNAVFHTKLVVSLVIRLVLTPVRRGIRDSNSVREIRPSLILVWVFTSKPEDP